MTQMKKMMLGTVAVLTMTSSMAMANDFTSHQAVDEKTYEKYAEQLPGDEKLELREYLNYEQREPCQFYQPIPEGFVQDGCDIVREQPMQVAAVQKPAPQPAPKAAPAPRKVLADYEVHFAFDSAAIEPAAGGTLEQVADEIKKYNPGEVTVAGHADKAGPADYNITLSQKRAQAVSDALTERGVQNRVIDKEAYGEMNPAVPTDDGVALEENRRVVVEFLK